MRHATARPTSPLLWLCLLAAAPAPAVDLFVKPAGSGTACTQSSPCTLATALATAATDDSLHLAAGVYTGTGTEVVLLDKTVSLLGGWSGSPSGAVVRDPVAYESILDGEYARRAARIIDGAPTLDGLTITRGNATGLGGGCNLTSQYGCGGGILVASAGLTLTSCLVAGNVALADPRSLSEEGFGGGMHAYRAQSLLVEGCTFRDNTASTSSTGTGGGVDVARPDGSVIIRGNRLVANRGTSSGAHSGYGGGVALRYSRRTPLALERNVLLGNAARAATGNTSVNADGNAVLVDESTATVVGNQVRSDAPGFAVMFQRSSGEVRGNTVFAGADYSALYFYPGDGVPVHVSNNVLVGGIGATLRAHSNAGELVVLEAVHNTIVGDGRQDGVEVGDGASVNLTNTIISRTNRTTRVVGSGALTLDHTLYDRNISYGSFGTNSFNGDARFVNVAAGDFHIEAGSDAIGAGVDLGVLADIDGEARPGPGGVDIGADEVAPRRFDFGTAGSPVAEGYAQVTHATTFSPERGFGWTYGTVASRDRGAANNDLRRDLCFATTANFGVLLPNGRYRVTVTMGDAAAGHGQMAVHLETVKVATVSTAGNEFKELTFETAVADGRLDVWLNDEGGADPNVVVNALAIAPALPVMIDLGTAASPLAAGYARATHATAYAPGAAFGWVGGIVQSRDRGTADPLTRDLVFSPRALLASFLPDGVYDVIVTMGDAAGAHTMMGVSTQGSAFDPVSASKNQFASRRYRAAVADNRLEVLLDDLEGPDVNTVLNAVEVRPPFPTLFDFGTPTSSVRVGSLRVSHQTAYSPQLGYGWAAGTIGSRDRGNPWNIWTRDFNFTADGTFVVDVMPGRYSLRFTFGDYTASHDQFAVEIEGTRVETIDSLPAGTATSRSYAVSVLDGQLTVRLVDVGGVDANAVINALEVR